MASRDLRSLTDKEIWGLKSLRWKARTDLGFLCREVLGYRDVMYVGANVLPSDLENGCPTEPIHQPVIDLLQKFPTPTPDQFEQNDNIVGGRWSYTPIKSMMQLTGKRRALLIDHRGSLKTSLNMVAHTIQWILNYPDIAMMLVQSNDDKSQANLFEVKRHFIGNKIFRELFPDHCPRKTMDWGTSAKFTTEARDIHVVRKEPTCYSGSLEKGAAGLHFNVMKFSDIVEPTTVKGMGLEGVKQSFYMMEHLLVSPRYWIDVEGTRYHNDDLYGDIIRHEERLSADERRYKIHLRGIFVKQQVVTDYNSASLKLPNKLDEDGNEIVLWPQRFPPEAIRAMRKQNLWSFATQYLNDPSAVAGEIYFPIDKTYPRWIKRSDYVQNVRVAYREITIDTAETDTQRSNYSVITTAAWDSAGRVYVEKIDRGKWLPNVLVMRILHTIMTTKNLNKVKVEKVSFVNGLMTSLQRETDIRGIYVPWELLPRDNKQKKTERIMMALQTPYINKNIIFLDDIDADTKIAMLEELEQFPSPRTDDILDTLADLFQGRDWMGREQPRKTFIQAQSDAWNKALDIADWRDDPDAVQGAGVGYSTQQGNLFRIS